jgi:hypothetical protein
MTTLLENPEFMRYFRSSTRKGRATTYYTLFLIACGLCLTVNLLLFYKVRAYQNLSTCVRSVFYQIMGANFLLLLGFGAHACGDSVTSERQSNTLEFQRITGMNPYTLAIGKILGVPLVFYLLAAVGMPVTMLCVICGGVSLTGYLASYLLLFISVCFFCSAATLASGLRRGKTTQRTSPIVLLVVLLWFGPTIGFAMARPGRGAGISSSGLWTCLFPFHSLRAAGQETLDSYEVPLFGAQVSGVAMTMIMNAFLFLICWAGTARRLASDSQSLWTKPQLLAGSLGFFVLLGSYLWNAPPSLLNPPVAMSTATIAVHVILLVVATVASPGLYSFRLGLRRKASGQRAGIPWLAEGALALPLIFVLGLVYVGLVLAIIALGKVGVTGGTPSLGAVLFFVPLLLCGMMYTVLAQLCKLFAPQQGMKVYAGILFLWAFIPLIAWSILKSWNPSPAVDQIGAFVLLLSPVGTCVNSLQDSGLAATGNLQFWGATLVLAVGAGALWFALARHRSNLERKFAR